YKNPDGKHAEAARLLFRIAGNAEAADLSQGAADEPVFGECPFPGLEAFDESLAAVFFGREAETSEAVAKLGSAAEGHRRWLQIEGPGGVGKSSLARAGIVSAVRKG